MGKRHEHRHMLRRPRKRAPGLVVDGPDHVVQMPSGESPLKCQRADRDDESRAERCQHAVEPGRAEADLGGAGTPVTRAVGAAPREAGGHRGHVDAITNIVLVAESGTNQPAHQLASGPSRKWPGLIVFDRAGRLPDEEDALARAAAEHRVRPRDVAGVGAARACALRALQGSQRATQERRFRHGDPTLTRRGSVAEPEAISSPHRSSLLASSLSGRRGQPSHTEAPCPTSLRAPPGLTASDEMTAPRRGGRRSIEPTFLTTRESPLLTAAGTRPPSLLPPRWSRSRGGHRRRRRAEGG